MENTPPDKPLRKATKASIKSKYDVHARSASATLSVNVGDLKLKTTCTDATLVKGPCLDGIVLGVEKPGFFMIDYDLPKKATRFQFMSSAKISGKQCKLTYIHAQKANMTMLDGSLAFDPSNKLSADYSFMTGSGQLRYSYIHQGDRTFEPAYAFKTNSWNFSLSQKVYGADTLKTSYETSNKRLGLEWTRESKDAGSFKCHECCRYEGVAIDANELVLSLMSTMCEKGCFRKNMLRILRKL